MSVCACVLVCVCVCVMDFRCIPGVDIGCAGLDMSHLLNRHVVEGLMLVDVCMRGMEGLFTIDIQHAHTHTHTHTYTHTTGYEPLAQLSIKLAGRTNLP
jgi:hypothetical protein